MKGASGSSCPPLGPGSLSPSDDSLCSSLAPREASPSCCMMPPLGGGVEPDRASLMSTAGAACCGEGKGRGGRDMQWGSVMVIGGLGKTEMAREAFKYDEHKSCTTRMLGRE